MRIDPASIRERLVTNGQACRKCGVRLVQHFRESNYEFRLRQHCAGCQPVCEGCGRSLSVGSRARMCVECKAGQRPPAVDLDAEYLRDLARHPAVRESEEVA